jgi:uncharacterized protein YgiM (DUF1202 family)
MRRFVLFASIAVLTCLLLTACAKKTQDQSTLRTQIAAEIYATLTAVAPTETDTPQPTPTVTITPFPTLSPTPMPQGVIQPVVLNMREGPGLDYAVLDGLKSGDIVSIVGQYSTCAWLKIMTQAGKEGWIKGDSIYVQYTAECASLAHGSFRPATGTVIADKRAVGGLGQLKVQNGTDTDGVVLITTEDGTLLLSFYVRLKEEFTYTGVPNGKMLIYFMLGSNWDGDEKRFMQISSTRKMDQPLEFATTGTSFSVWTISLNPVESGTGKASDVPPDQFPILP